MPPKRSDNTEAINLKIPKAWIDLADKLARDGAAPVQVSRTAMLRAALGFGLEGISKGFANQGVQKMKAVKKKRARRRRVSEPIRQTGS